MKTADLLNISFTVRWPGRPLAYIILDIKYLILGFRQAGGSVGNTVHA